MHLTASVKQKGLGVLLTCISAQRDIDYVNIDADIYSQGAGFLQKYPKVASSVISGGNCFPRQSVPLKYDFLRLWKDIKGCLNSCLL